MLFSIERLRFTGTAAWSDPHDFNSAGQKNPVGFFFPQGRGGKGKGCNAAQEPAEGTARLGETQDLQKDLSFFYPKAELEEMGMEESRDDTGGKIWKNGSGKFTVLMG